MESLVLYLVFFGDESILIALREILNGLPYCNMGRRHLGDRVASSLSHLVHLH